jgi:GxxExxY protein
MISGEPKLEIPIRDPVSEKVIGAALDVHRALGPGLLESAYSECLAYELSQRGILFKREVPLPVRYKNVLLDCGYRLDFLVADHLVVELKAVEKIEGVHEAQLLTYLRLSGKRVGLLINFNVELLRDGIRRRVL